VAARNLKSSIKQVEANFDSSRPRVALINLNFASDRRFLLTNLGDSLMNRHEIAIHGIPVQTRDLSDL